MAIRHEHDADDPAARGTDWLDLCLPLGALGYLDERVGAYPFGDMAGSRAWREPIERWFTTIVFAVFDAAPFVHAITGDDVSGDEPADVQHQELGVFRHGPDGTLIVEPVRSWH